MARFFTDQESRFHAPDVSVKGGSVTYAPPKKKEKSQDAKAQEPIRKTEGGRYDDLDYSDLA